MATGQRSMRGGVSAELMKTPLRKPRALSNLPVNNARDWVSIFSSLLAPKHKHVDLKINIPHTILISSSGNPCSWYYSSQKGGLKKKKSQNVDLRMMRAKFAELSEKASSGDDVIGILRHGFSSRLLTASTLEPLFEQLEHHTFGGADELPFCVQEYIAPLDNARYVTTFQETLQGDVVCDSFVCEYSSRYKLWKHSEIATDDTPDTSYLEHSPVEEQQLLNSLKDKTILLVNTINRGQTTTRLQGMVCEYIVGEDDTLYLHAILGTHFSGASLSSWDNTRTLNPDAELICNMLANCPEAKSSSTIISEMSDTRPATSRGKIPQPPAAGSSQARPRTTSRLQYSSQFGHTNGAPFGNSRIHAPIHRYDRPGLVVELSQQLEIYKAGLEYTRDVCEAAVARAQQQREWADDEEKQHQQLQQEMGHLISSHGERQNELQDSAKSLQMNIDELLQAEADAAEGLRNSEKEHADLARALDDERATAFGLMGGLQRNIANLEASLEKSHDSMRELHHEQDKLAHHAQLEISQNSELTEQLRKANDLAEELNQSKAYHKRYCDDLGDKNDKLKRYTPLQEATSTVRRQAKHLQVYVKDLVSATLNPPAELELAKHLVLKHTSKLRPIFFYYANTEVSHGSPIDGKTMTLGEVSKFIRDCKVTNQSGFSQASMDIIMQQTHYSDRMLFFPEWMEVLLRIANAKYPDLESLGGRFEAFLAEEVYANAKKKTHKELVKEGHIKH